MGVEPIYKRFAGAGMDRHAQLAFKEGAVTAQVGNALNSVSVDVRAFPGDYTL